MNLTRRDTLAGSAAVFFSALCGGVPGAWASSTSAPEDLGKEAYIYGFPLVDLYRILWGQFADAGGPAYRGGVNTVYSNGNVTTPADTLTQTTNSDTPYSRALLDLRAEPMVVTLPQIEKNRYYTVQIVDLYTYNSAYLGTRTTGNQGGDFLIAGPGWRGTTPKNIRKVIHADTQLLYLNYRTQLFKPADIDSVRKIQAEYQITPLSKYADAPAPASAPALEWIKAMTPAEERISLDFFNVLAWVLQYCPPFADEVDFRKRLASIGVVPGKPFAAEKLSPTGRQALLDGMKAGQQAIDAKRAASTSSVALFGSREQLGTNYLNRSVGAQVGIIGNTAAEAMYFGFEFDAEKQRFSGENNYILHFARGGLPPVNAFWSMTMYDVPNLLLVANPINRYLVNSPMLPDLKKDADGGYTIYIQHESPGADKESNWLPSPSGPFFMVMRCYYPKRPVIDGTWKPPALIKI